MNLIIKRADLTDWDCLSKFYSRIYPRFHPLSNLEFFKWQYGEIENGSAYILRDSDQVYGHVGAYFAGGIAWMINVYLDESMRGQGWIGQLYSFARHQYQLLAATSANEAGLGLYRNMNWYRYSNLERYICVHPKFKQNELDFSSMLQPSLLNYSWRVTSNEHYWKQPGIVGHTFADGSTGVYHAETNGFRFVCINDIQVCLNEIWNLGVTWCDFVTSWNDKKIIELEKMNWKNNRAYSFPWYLNPINFEKKFQISFLSEKVLDSNFICRRTYSDHGRVGSLIV